MTKHSYLSPTLHKSVITPQSEKERIDAIIALGYHITTKSREIEEAIDILVGHAFADQMGGK